MPGERVTGLQFHLFILHSDVEGRDCEKLELSNLMWAFRKHHIDVMLGQEVRLSSESDTAAHLLQPVQQFQSMPVLNNAVLNDIQTFWHDRVHGLVLGVQYFDQIDLLQTGIRETGCALGLL